jgi:hypothetical protein
MHTLALAVLLVALAVMGTVLAVNRRRIARLEAEHEAMAERLRALGVVDQVIAHALQPEPVERGRHLRVVKVGLAAVGAAEVLRRHTFPAAVAAAGMAGVVGVSTLVHTAPEPPARLETPAEAEPARRQPGPGNDGTVRSSTKTTTTTTTMAPTASSLPVMRETTTTSAPPEPATTSTTTSTTVAPLVETTVLPGPCALDVDLPPVVDTCI